MKKRSIVLVSDRLDSFRGRDVSTDRILQDADASYTLRSACGILRFREKKELDQPAVVNAISQVFTRKGPLKKEFKGVRSCVWFPPAAERWSVDALEPLSNVFNEVVVTKAPSSSDMVSMVMGFLVDRVLVNLPKDIKESIATQVEHIGTEDGSLQERSMQTGAMIRGHMEAEECFDSVVVDASELVDSLDLLFVARFMNILGRNGIFTAWMSVESGPKASALLGHGSAMLGKYAPKQSETIHEGKVIDEELSQEMVALLSVFMEGHTRIDEVSTLFALPSQWDQKWMDFVDKACHRRIFAPHLLDEIMYKTGFADKYGA